MNRQSAAEEAEDDRKREGYPHRHTLARAETMDTGTQR